MLLTGYAPVHTATPQLPAGLQPLDPATDVKIEFEDGLAVQNRAFAEGHPPRITISPEPSGASVTIGGRPATLAAGRGWVAPGWDAPGHHMVDVTPGPSAKYEIVADPWSLQNWKFWNGHPVWFRDHIGDAWEGIEICGASIQGPEGQAVIAARTDPILVALGRERRCRTTMPAGRHGSIHGPGCRTARVPAERKRPAADPRQGDLAGTCAKRRKAEGR